MIDLHALFSEPVIITSIQALEVRKHYLVRVRSADGAEGVVTTNNRLAYLWTILDNFVAPYFLGKDARDLPNWYEMSILFAVHTNWRELHSGTPSLMLNFAVLDLLGKIARKICW